MFSAIRYGEAKEELGTLSLLSGIEGIASLGLDKIVITLINKVACVDIQGHTI